MSVTTPRADTGGATGDAIVCVGFRGVTSAESAEEDVDPLQSNSRRSMASMPPQLPLPPLQVVEQLLAGSAFLMTSGLKLDPQ